MTPNDDDRRAADEHFELWYPNTAWGYDPLVLTLAAHRLAAERRGIERAAGVADEHACQHCAHISAAIRAITTEGTDK